MQNWEQFQICSVCFIHPVYIYIYHNITEIYDVFKNARRRGWESITIGRSSIEKVVETICLLTVENPNVTYWKLETSFL
jgi:hypothetical protein